MLRIVASVIFTMAAKAIHADEKGKNDWSKENIGNVIDAVFLGNKQSYMLSDDNLLTYFANTAQQPLWRKELPTQFNEAY